MKRRDLESELADIERRRLEGKLSHEEAILARQNIVEENKQRVSEMKEEVGTGKSWSCIHQTIHRLQNKKV